MKDYQDVHAVLSTMFSKKFQKEHPEVVERYVRYRMAGGNRQGAKGFKGQLNALRNFMGEMYFSEINPAEAFFTGGKSDELFGSEHSDALAMILPGAVHREIDGLGHMINLERPDLFDLRSK